MSVDLAILDEDPAYTDITGAPHRYVLQVWSQPGGDGERWIQPSPMRIVFTSLVIAGGVMLGLTGVGIWVWATSGDWTGVWFVRWVIAASSLFGIGAVMVAGGVRRHLRVPAAPTIRVDPQGFAWPGVGRFEWRDVRQVQLAVERHRDDSRIEAYILRVEAETPHGRVWRELQRVDAEERHHRERVALAWMGRRLAAVHQIRRLGLREDGEGMG